MKILCKLNNYRFIFGFFVGVGFSFIVALSAFVFLNNEIKSTILTKLNTAQQLLLTHVASNKEIKKQPLVLQKKVTNANLAYIIDNKRITIPADFDTFYISSAANFLERLELIKKSSAKGNAFVFDDGTYQFTKTVLITTPNTIVTSLSGEPNKVVIKGNGMVRRDKVENIFEVHANGFILDGVTLQETGNHLIQIRGEKGANFPIIRNCILQDSYEQLIKVTVGSNPSNGSQSGLIEHCLFKYSMGIAPNFYTGGIDAHGIQNWIIRNNLFRDIASPAEHIAEYAIHLWGGSANNSVLDNIIIDSDRGIGFGLGNKQQNYSNYGGIISNNMIYHSNNGDKYADTGIALESSPYTIVENNYIYLEHSYSRAIEYRFPMTYNAKITANYTNKSISSRNQGEASVQQNHLNLTAVDFFYLLNQKSTAFSQYLNSP